MDRYSEDGEVEPAVRWQHEDLLTPDDAVVSRWGRCDTYSMTSSDTYSRLKTHDNTPAASPSPTSDDEGSESLASTLETPLSYHESVQSTPETPTKPVVLSPFRRSTPPWTMQSMLTALTSQSPSRRSSLRLSRIGSRASTRRNSTALSFRPPSRIFPLDILARILSLLRDTHEGPRSSTCSTCFLRDAYNIALVDKSWARAVQHEIYTHLHIDGPEQPIKRRSSKANLTRLTLLHRTLSTNIHLANKTTTLRIWNTSTLDEATLAQIASLVTLCPNLQSFSGTQQFYTHDFSALHQALATRPHLQSHMWIVGTPVPSQRIRLASAGYFLHLHSRWHELSTLALRCQRDATLDPECWEGLTQRLPALQNLSISGFDERSFSDSSLLALKPLVALRLADLPGVTDRGLTRFASSQAAQSLGSLSLIGLSIVSLSTISHVLARSRLDKFTFAQYRAVTLLKGEIVMQPFLASRSLRHLHWDLPVTSTGKNTSISQLISSIVHGGFPSLETLRCPSDPAEGPLQALCRPFVMPDEAHAIPSTRITGTTVRAVRLRAWARAAASRADQSLKSKDPSSNSGARLRVIDSDGYIEEEEAINWFGYAGYDRTISYSLTSDISSNEQRRWLAEEGDILGDTLESAAAGPGCQRKAAGRVHVERQRWTGGGMERLF